MVTLQQEVRFEASTETGATVIIDRGPESDGSSQSFRPMELMLLGLGGCMAFDVLMILQRMRKTVTSYRLNIEAERADTPPRVYTEVRLEHLFQGEGLTEAAIQRALNLAETSYCSAHAMFAKTARISNTFRIVEA